MNIKIQITKRKLIIVAGIAVVALIGWRLWGCSDMKIRRDLKAACMGENCACFRNVLDYRFTEEEIRLYARIQEEAKVRPNASALEFATPEQFQSMMSALAACQPHIARPIPRNIPQQQVIRQPVQQAQPAPQPVARSTEQKSKAKK